VPAFVGDKFPQFDFFPVVIMSIFFNMLALLTPSELTQRVVILPRILAWFGRTERGEV
jgi:hypothetical protein